MTNFAKLGEFIAYREQVYDAAYRRYTLIHCLCRSLEQWRDDVSTPVPDLRFHAELTEIARADREMRIALVQANQAAALCGKPPLRLDDLNRKA